MGGRTLQLQRLVAVIVAAVGTANAVLGLLAPSPGPLYVALLVLALLPGALLLGARPRTQQAVGALLVVAGMAGLVPAGIAAGRSDALDPVLATIGWSFLVSFGSALAPFPLALALVLGGGGLLLGRRGPMVAACVLGITVAGWYVVAAVAPVLAAIDDLGRVVAPPLVLLAVLLGAGVLLAALAVGPALRGLAPPRSIPTARGPRPVVAAAVVVVVLAAGGLGWWLLLGPRLVLAEAFPDPALARCVAAALGEDDPSASVSASDLGHVLSLSCDGEHSADGLLSEDLPVTGEMRDAFRMRDLRGIERLTNLATLELPNHRIGDLGPLTGMRKLGSIVLTGNGTVADLAPLASLPVLVDLGVSGNAVDDLGPLAGVRTLTALGIADNRVTDLAPLAGLSALDDLDASRNGITDVTPLARLTALGHLDLAGNRIPDLSPLGGLARLSELDVSGNQVTGVAGLEGCAYLDELWLGGNPIADLTPLLGLPALVGVDIEGLSPATPGIEELRAQGIYVGGLA